MACDVRLPTLEWPGTWEEVKFTSRDQMWVCPYALREANGLQAYLQHSHMFKEKFNLAIVELCLKTSPLLRFSMMWHLKIKISTSGFLCFRQSSNGLPRKDWFPSTFSDGHFCVLYSKRLSCPPRICVTTIKDNFAIIPSLTFMTKFDQN